MFNLIVEKPSLYRQRVFRGSKVLLVIHVTWNYLVVLFFLCFALLLASYSLRPEPKVLGVGTDLFWATYEVEYPHDAIPEESEAVLMLERKGYVMDYGIGANTDARDLEDEQR